MKTRKTITFQMPDAEGEQTAHLFEDRVERFTDHVASRGGKVLTVADFNATEALAGLRATLGPLVMMTESPPCQQAALPSKTGPFMPCPGRPAGEVGEFFSDTHGWTVWDRRPRSLAKDADRFALYNPAGEYMGHFSSGTAAEREAVFLMGEK